MDYLLYHRFVGEEGRDDFNEIAPLSKKVECPKCLMSLILNFYLDLSYYDLGDLGFK